MNYSDENLYQQLLALSHSLRRSHGHRPSGFPPHGHRPPGFPPHGHAMSPDACDAETASAPCGSPDPREHLFSGSPLFDMREGFTRRRREHTHGKHEHLHEGHAHTHGKHGHPGGGHFPSPDDHRPPLARERILRLVGETEPVSQTILAEHLSIRPQSLSEQLAKLESDGLVLREPSGQDKRVTLVSLTETGRQRMREVEAARAEQSAAFLSPLSQEEREQLFFLLQKLTSRA